MKECSKCKENKRFEEFHKNYKNADGRHYHCKSCRKEESLKQYNMTLVDYDNLLRLQDGKCAICKTNDPRGQSTAGRFYVDHNHSTGEVRGLLCNDCNTALGLFKDSTKLLNKASSYLKEKGSYSK